MLSPAVPSPRLNPPEACLDKIEPIDEGVDEANRIVRANVIVHRFRQQQKLIAFEPGHVRHTRF